MRTPSLRPLIVAAITATMIGAPSAMASHIKGGSIDAALGADGHLTGTVGLVVASTSPCPTAAASVAQSPVSVAGPPGYTATTGTLTGAKVTSCLPSTKTEGATYDVDLTGAPDGTYTVTYTNCCGVSPIVNGGSSSATFTATITKAGNTITSTPVIAGDPALGVSIHTAYSSALSATNAAGGPLAFTLLQSTTSGQPDFDASAPATNIVGIDANGLITIPASVTSTLAPGKYYAFKTRVTNSQGNSAERSLMLTVTSNRAPALDAITSPVTVVRGQSVTVTLSVPDPDTTQKVVVSAAGLPAWATLTPAAAANPGTATLTLTPPAATPLGDTTITLNADDNDSAAPLRATRQIVLRVTDPAPTPTPTPPAVAPTTIVTTAPPVASTNRTPYLAFSGPAGATFQCSLDGGPFVACTSPWTPSSPLALGSHTLRVQAALNGVVQATPTVITWTTAAPTPVLKLNVAAVTVVRKGVDPAVKCRVARASLKSCTVVASQTVSVNGKRRQVVVATGRVGAVRAGQARVVRLKVTTAGRRAIARLGGVKVRVQAAGKAAANGRVVRARTNAHLLPRMVRFVTRPGAFAHGTSVIAPSARAWVGQKGRQFGPAKLVLCIGHADSTGSVPGNLRVALNRAKRVCAATQTTAPTKVSVRTLGDYVASQTNRTPEGRAANRRVEVQVHYR